MVTHCLFVDLWIFNYIFWNGLKKKEKEMPCFRILCPIM